MPVKKNEKAEAAEKTKETSVKKEENAKKKEATESGRKKKVEKTESVRKPAKSKADKAAAESSFPEVSEVVVPAEIIQEEASLSKAEPKKKDGKEQPGRYRNIGTFSADIDNEFAAINTTRAQEEDYSFRFMRKCKYNGEILVGTVISIEDDPKKMMLGARLLYEPRQSRNHWGAVEVLIPEMVFFEPGKHFTRDYETKSLRDQYLIRKQAILQYLGAKIHFCVMGVSREVTEDPRFSGQYVTSVIGDRTSAMKKLRDKYFFHKNKKKPGKTITVREDDLVEGFVVGVNDQYVTVVALGVESRIHINDLCPERISSCLQYTRVGDVLPELRIREIKINGDRVRLGLTNRMKRGAQKAILSMKKGSYYVGRVIWFNPEKDIYTIMLSNGVTAFVYRNNVMGFVDLSINDVVSVCVSAIHNDIVTGNAVKI